MEERSLRLIDDAFLLIILAIGSFLILLSSQESISNKEMIFFHMDHFRIV